MFNIFDLIVKVTYFK